MAKRLYYYTDWKARGWYPDAASFRRANGGGGEVVVRSCCPEDTSAPAGYRKTGRGLANDPAERVPTVRGFVRALSPA